jgi:Amt family ammonium transporter
VDDRPENRQLFAQLLVPLGFRVREASNGEEAIAIWADWRPHAIFMDTRMPVMDGFRAIEQIRDRTQFKQTVIIAITSSGMASQQVDQLAIACDDILHKPFNVDTILDKLAKQLGVVYRYEEIDEINLGKDRTQTLPTCTLKPADLALMSQDWRNQVYQAASAGDSAMLLELIRQIPVDKPRLIGEITDLVQFFQFSVLRELTVHEPIELSR